jgi:transposase-like protein
MKLHANAALSFRQRERMVRRVVDQGWSVREAAVAAEVSARTAGKWVARYRAEGSVGLLDRSSAPLFVANRSSEGTVDAIAALRRLRFTGPEISEVLELPASTVSGILLRIGMGRLGRLGMEPAERYERTVAGELIHIDVKKLGRIHVSMSWTRILRKLLTAAQASGSRAFSATQRVSGLTAMGSVGRSLGGSVCISRSMTRHAWPMPRCSPTRKQPQRSRSCAARSRSMSATACRSANS